MMNYKNTKLIKRVLFIMFFLIFILIIIFPFYWMIVTSLKSPDALVNFSANLIPPKVYFENYIYVFENSKLLKYLQNSLIVSGGTTIICMWLASLSAYSIARLKIKGKKYIMAFILAVSVFPGIAMVSPLFVIFKEIHILNTYWGLILPYITFALPLAIWNLHAYFKDIPKEMEESAKIDGASSLKILWKIILPITAPGLFTTAIIVFISSWNEFLFGLIFVSKDSMRTVPVGIMMFQGEYNIPWGELSAAAVVATVPIIIVVLIFQKRIVSGITAGAVKG